jgi:hypothetical protein
VTKYFEKLNCGFSVYGFVPLMEAGVTERTCVLKASEEMFRWRDDDEKLL